MILAGWLTGGALLLVLALLALARVGSLCQIQRKTRGRSHDVSTASRRVSQRDAV